MKSIFNKSKTLKVIITRTMLSDGYNYYLNLYAANESVWYESYKQINSIYSLKNAIAEAKKVLISYS